MRCLVLTDLTTQKLVEAQVAAEAAQSQRRQRVAREVNDTIVQGLVAAEMALDLGQVGLRPRADRAHVHATHGTGSASSPATSSSTAGMAVRSTPALHAGED